MNITKGQRVRITQHLTPGINSVVSGEIVYEGTVTKVGDDTVALDGAEDWGHFVNCADTRNVTVRVQPLGYPEGCIAYIDANDGNDETKADILVRAKSYGWVELDGGYAHWLFDDENVHNVRLIHDGQVPK